jgi:pyrimidine-nucleoside phosphorylase
MRHPLGKAIGNVLEMMEVEEFFRGNLPVDLEKVCIALAASMVLLSDDVNGETFESASKLCRKKLSVGAAREAFLRFIKAQGGKVREDGSLVYSVLPQECGSVVAKRDGFVSEVFASGIGKASVRLGAGRNTKSDLIDAGAGIMLNKKIGDYVKKGEKLCTLYTGENSSINSSRIEDAILEAQNAFILGDEKENTPPEILDILS